MPVVVVGRSDIGPASTGDGPEDADTKNELGKGIVGSCSQDIPKGDQEKSRACIHVQILLFPPGRLLLTRSDCDEDLEHGSLGISVTDCCRY